MRTAATLIALTLLTSTALADPSHAHEAAAAYGEPGDPSADAQTVEIEMDETEAGEMVFRPDRIEVDEGQQVRFVLKNEGDVEHEFVLGTREEIEEHAEEMRESPQMDHDDPNAERVDPGREDDLVWKFDEAGEFDFACLIPGHLEAGMSGEIVVR